jgi:GAF domain-containing protein
MRPSDVGGTARAIRDCALIQIPDVRADPHYKIQEAPGFRAVVAAPMLREGRAIGAITVGRAEPGLFSDMQVQLLGTFANQAVIAIENTRLLNEMRNSLQQQTATADVLKVISSSPGELETILSTVLENAVRICEASFGNMYLHDGDVFRLAAAHDTPPALAEERKRAPLRGRTSNLGRMVQTKQVVHVVDLSAEQSYLDRDPEAVSGVELGHIRTIVFVPMLKDTDLIGAIANPSSSRPLLPTCSRLLADPPLTSRQCWTHWSNRQRASVMPMTRRSRCARDNC